MYKLAWLLLVLLISTAGFAGTESNVDSLSWKCTHDLGTPGTSQGDTSIVPTPSRHARARRFDISWDAYGGERCSVSLATLDTTSTDFTVDLWWFITDLSHVNNLEFDLNQVLPNRDTVIYGTECSLPMGKWKFTTRVGASAHWNPSNATCNRKVWTANTWHHLVLQFHRDQSGVVTYDSVSLDDDTQSFVDASGPSDFALRWFPPGLLKVNFQIDGDNSVHGTTAYLDSVTVSGSRRSSRVEPTHVTGVGY